MATEDPLWIQGLTYSGREDRTVIESVFGEGVIEAGHLVVSPRQAGANMSVDVATGTAAVTGDDQAYQGRYLIRSTAVENVAVGAAPASNSRIDLVVAQVQDASVVGAVNGWVISVLAGAASASPVAPALPSTAIALAEVRVPAGTASIDASLITDRRSIARVPGGAPVGSVIMTAAAVAPSGYLLCNGTAVSRSVYADLFTALGGGASPWGLGDGSTTFNVPNMVNKLPMGAGSTAARGASPLLSHGHTKTGGVNVNSFSAGGETGHGHGWSGTTAGENQEHIHWNNFSTGGVNNGNPGLTHIHINSAFGAGQYSGVNDENLAHGHPVVGDTGGRSAQHSHGVSGTVGGSTGHNHDASHGHSDSIAVASVAVATVAGLNYAIRF